MKFPIIIKQSPFVLIIRIIQMELVIGVILFALSFLANYEDLYRSTPVYDFVRYDVFLVVISSIVQLIITLLVFFGGMEKNIGLKKKK